MLTTLLFSLLATQGGLQIQKVSSSPLRPIAMAAAPSGSRVAMSMEDRSIRIVEASNGVTVKSLGQHPQSAYAIAWSKDGKWIASGDESARIWLWDAATGKKVREYRTHTKGIQKLSFDPTGKWLLSTGKDDDLMLYSLASTATKQVKHLPSGGLNWYSATYGPSGSFMVGTLTPAVKVFAGSLAPVRSFSGHGGLGMQDLDMSSTGIAATAGRDNNVQIWNPSTGSIGKFMGHTEWVTNVRFSPNGQYLASGSVDRTVRVWSVKGAKTAASLADQSGLGSILCWTADGKYLLTTDVGDNLQINKILPPQGGKGVPTKKGKSKRKH